MKNRIILSLTTVLLLGLVAALTFLKNKKTNLDPLIAQAPHLQHLIDYNKSMNSVGPGVVRLMGEVRLPDGMTLEFKPGTIILAEQQSRLMIKGKIIAKGTTEYPIIFKARVPGTYWSGIKLEGMQSQVFEKPTAATFFELENFLTWLKQFKGWASHASQFSHVTFSNIQRGKKEDVFKNNYIAALEATDTDIVITNSSFYDIRFGGGIFILKSRGIFLHNQFLSDEIHKNFAFIESEALAYGNTIFQNHALLNCNDGFWVINSRFVGTHNVISGKGDDGLDLKGSLAFIEYNNFLQNGDEAIDIDNGSHVISHRNRGQGNGNGLQISESEVFSLEESMVSSRQNNFIARDGAKVIIQNSECTEAEKCPKSIYKKLKVKLNSVVLNGKQVSGTPENLSFPILSLKQIEQIGAQIRSLTKGIP